MAPKFHRGFVLAVGVIPLVAYAKTYMTEEQAVQEIFPGQKLARKNIELTSAEADAIGDKSGERVRDRTLIGWVSPGKDVLFIDQVVGKHEFITYAVGIRADGSVAGVDILDYRETYGYDVKKPEWRGQFTGKTKDAPLKVGKDVVNLSGATLSSVHLTGGVRRILQTYDAIRGRL